MRHRLLALTMIAGIALDLSGALDLSDATAQERSGALAATRQGTLLVTDSRNHERIVVRTRGEVRVSDDGRRVVALEPEGYLILEEDGAGKSRRLEIRADVDGTLRTSWFVDGEQRQAGRDADAWLAETLPRAEELLTRYADHWRVAEDLREMERELLRVSHELAGTRERMEVELRDALRKAERLRSGELRAALEEGERGLHTARIEQRRALEQARRDARGELEGARRGWEDAHSLELQVRESVEGALSDALRQLERAEEIRELEFVPELERSLELLRRQLEELEAQLDHPGFGRVYHL